MEAKLLSSQGCHCDTSLGEVCLISKKELSSFAKSLGVPCARDDQKVYQVVDLRKSHYYQGDSVNGCKQKDRGQRDLRRPSAKYSLRVCMSGRHG